MQKPEDMPIEWLAGFEAACSLLARDAVMDRYGIGSMCSMWRAEDVADDMRERVMEAWDARKEN